MSENFCDNLKNARMKCNLPQVEMAEKLGVARSTYSMYERGSREPNLQTIKKMANILKVTVEYLMTGEEKEPTQNYYLNEDAREIAEFMFKNPEYKVLFDASRKVSKDDIEMVKAIMDKFRADQDPEEE